MTDLLLPLSPFAATRPYSDVDDRASIDAGLTPVVLAHASPALLGGLEAMVVTTPGLRLAGAASNFERLLACCRSLQGGVALVDAELGRDGIAASVEILTKAAPALRLVLMTDAPLPHLVRAAFERGVSRFVDRGADISAIRVAVCAAAAGQRHIPAAVSEQLAASLGHEWLTAREMDVLRLLSQGRCNKSIASDLRVGISTVKTHVHAIMSKLSADSRMHAVLMAGRLGVIRL